MLLNIYYKCFYYKSDSALIYYNIVTRKEIVWKQRPLLRFFHCSRKSRLKCQQRPVQNAQDFHNTFKHGRQ